MSGVTNGWQRQGGFGWFAYWHPEKKVGFVLDNWGAFVITDLEALNDKEAKEFELYFYDRNLKGMKKVLRSVKR